MGIDRFYNKKELHRVLVVINVKKLDREVDTDKKDVVQLDNLVLTKRKKNYFKNFVKIKVLEMVIVLDKKVVLEELNPKMV